MVALHNGATHDWISGLREVFGLLEVSIDRCCGTLPGLSRFTRSDHVSTHIWQTLNPSLRSQNVVYMKLSLRLCILLLYLFLKMGLSRNLKDTCSHKPVLLKPQIWSGFTMWEAQMLKIVHLQSLFSGAPIKRTCGSSLGFFICKLGKTIDRWHLGGLMRAKRTKWIHIWKVLRPVSVI